MVMSNFPILELMDVGASWSHQAKITPLILKTSPKVWCEKIIIRSKWEYKSLDLALSLIHI